MNDDKGNFDVASNQPRSMPAWITSSRLAVLAGVVALAVGGYLLWLLASRMEHAMEDTIRQAGGPKSPVTLSLTQVRAKRDDHGIGFICMIEIDNDTGKELPVKSRYSSAFDMLTLIIFDSQGRKLAQVGYWQKLAPNSEVRIFPLQQGKNTGQLGFPILDFPAEVKECWVLLTGRLPDSGFVGTLHSDLVPVRIK